MNEIVKLADFVWEKGTWSINDYIRDFLKRAKISYFNTMAGDIYAKYGPSYCKLIAKKVKDNTFDILADLGTSSQIGEYDDRVKTSKLL